MLHQDRPLDLIVLGATGFVGRQCVSHVREFAPAGLRWALAGRDAARLAATAIEAGLPDLERIVIDTSDVGAVREMVGRCRVVLTTVGPYAKYGSAVVAACAALGTDYADITGETTWVRRMIDAHHDEAVASGARIVPFCGFDSVPSDLGVWMLVDWIREHWQLPTREVRAVFSAKGGFNGGTLDTALTAAEHGESALVADPFLLNPLRTGPAPERSQDRWVPGTDPDLGAVAPFFMAPTNTRVVRRSHALLAARGQDYGAEFAYQEYMRVPGGLFGGWGMTLGLGAVGAVASVEWGRALLRRVVPKPGEGPSVAEMDSGFMSVRLVGVAEDGRKVFGKVVGKGDPGNRMTTIMLCESALCLLEDRPPSGGVLTPACMAAALLTRLRARGIVFEVSS